MKTNQIWQTLKISVETNTVSADQMTKESLYKYV